MAKSIFSAAHFNDEAAAYAYVEARLWPSGPVCPHCGTVDRAGRLKGASNRPGLWKCYACRKPFTVKVGTIFEASHIAMRDWLTAIHLICSSKKGISSNQLHRTLGITLKSAWFMSHRIREAMKDDGSSGPLGGEGKIVEADETFFGKVKGAPKKPQGGWGHKIAVVSLVERGGRIRSKRIKATTKAEIEPVLYKNVHPASELHTDGAQHYKLPMAVERHEAVDHNKQYVRRSESGALVHTNTLEGYFSVFKRGLVGTYQHIEEQHTDRYLAEFDFRQNTRTKLGYTDTDRAEIALKGVVGKRLTYRTTDRGMTP